MLKFIFYLFGDILMFYHLLWIINFKQMYQYRLDFIRVMDNKIDKEGFDPRALKEIGDGCVPYFFHIFSMLWGLLGLMTFNWFLFLIMIAWTILTQLTIKVTPNASLRKAILFINSTFMVLMLAFCIVNSYLLKIDLYTLIKVFL